MKTLKKFGFTEKSIDDLVNIIINNTDYHSSFSKTEHDFPVSPLFVNKSRTPEQQIKRLKAVGIHNFIMLNIIPSEVNFKAVGTNGELYDFSLPRLNNRKTQIIEAFEKAVLHFNTNKQ